MNFILLSFLLFTGLTALAQTSYVAPTRLLSEKAYQFGVTTEYFSTSKRVDKDGKDVPFKDGEKFSRLQSEFAGYYGLTDNLQLGGGILVRQNDSVHLNSTTGVNDSETSVGVQSTFLNLMYAFKPIERLQYTLEGVYSYTPYSNEEASATDSGNLILGDDGGEYSFGMGVTYSSQTNNFLTARGGYRSPGQDLSDELYWQVEGALVWKNAALIAGVDGVSSLGNDPFEDTPSDKPVFNTGSTLLYNSTNREWIAPYAGLNVAMGQNWRVELKGSQVVSGQSTDLGTAFGIALIRRVDSKRSERTDSKFKEYDFEATITKVSAQKGFVVIDKGLADDIQKGMKIDFFEFDYVGGNILLASGIVLKNKADTSIVKITHRYNTKKELKEGIIARGSFR